MTIFRTMLVGTLSAVPALAFAQAGQPETATQPTEKVNQVLVYGDQPCPESKGDEIVVCARMGDEFRIPAPLRGDPNRPSNQSWAARAREMQYVGRSGIMSCSPQGGGGATGCFAELVRLAREERRQIDVGRVVIGEARAARLGQIDAKTEEIEARIKAEEAARAMDKAAAAAATQTSPPPK